MRRLDRLLLAVMLAWKLLCTRSLWFQHVVGLSLVPSSSLCADLVCLLMFLVVLRLVSSSSSVSPSLLFLLLFSVS